KLLWPVFHRRGGDDLDALAADRAVGFHHRLPAPVAAMHAEAPAAGILPFAALDARGDEAAPHHVAKGLRRPAEACREHVRRQQEFPGLVAAQGERFGARPGHCRASREMGAMCMESSPRLKAMASRKEWAMRIARTRKRSATSGGQSRSTVRRNNESQR